MAPFISKSAKRSYVEAKQKRILERSGVKEVIKYVEKPMQDWIVYWINKVDEEFAEYSSKLGIENRVYKTGDPSILLHAKKIGFIKLAIPAFCYTLKH